MSPQPRPVHALIGADCAAGRGAARVLEAAGATLRLASADDGDALRAALDGVHGVIAFADPWADGSPARIRAEAATLARAARDAKVAHLVWVTHEDIRRWVPLDDDRIPTLDGRWKVPCLDARGEANLLLRESGLPTTLLYPGFAWDDLVRLGLLGDDGEGGLRLTLPMGERTLPGLAASDIGACAAAALQRGQGYAGRSVGLAAEHLSGAQMAALLAQAIGRRVVHRSPPVDGLAAGALPNLFRFLHDFHDEVRARRPVEETRRLHPALQSFAAWAADHFPPTAP